MLKPCLGPGQALHLEEHGWVIDDGPTVPLEPTHPAVWSIIEWRCLPWWKRWWELVKP